MNGSSLQDWRGLMGQVVPEVLQCLYCNQTQWNPYLQRCREKYHLAGIWQTWGLWGSSVAARDGRFTTYRVFQCENRRQKLPVKDLLDIR
jgi:hypothetical protein